MTEFVQNYLGSIVVGLIIIAIAALIIIKAVKDKRAGKGSCGGNCSACGGCCFEHYQTDNDKKSPPQHSNK